MKRKCPRCGELFHNDNMKEFFDEETYKMLETNMKERINNNMSDIDEPMIEHSRKPILGQKIGSNLNNYSKLKKECSLCGGKANTDMFVHRCENGYMHPMCIIECWNINYFGVYVKGKSKTLTMTKEVYDSISFMCPICYETLNKNEVEKILNVEKNMQIKMRGSVPPTLKRSPANNDRFQFSIKKPQPRANPPIFSASPSPIITGISRMNYFTSNNRPYTKPKRFDIISGQKFSRNSNTYSKPIERPKLNKPLQKTKVTNEESIPFRRNARWRNYSGSSVYMLEKDPENKMRIMIERIGIGAILVIFLALCYKLY